MDLSTRLLGLPHSMAAGFHDGTFQKQETVSCQDNSGTSLKLAYHLFRFYSSKQSRALLKSQCGKGLDMGVNEGHSSLTRLQSNNLPYEELQKN